MATYFLKHGNEFRVSSSEAMDLHELLPPANYVVKKDQYDAFYLEGMENFTIPSKIYGTHTKDAKRILNTFAQRSGTTGVLLCGSKGSGKTMLSKLISSKGSEKGIPTIIVNAPHSGDAFNTFLDTITQPCIILFDEFEKVFDKDDQENILTLLDGVYGGKKLYILTTNDKWRIDVHMRNRPGRIFYLLEYNGISAEFIREYCEERLNNKQYIDQLYTLSVMFDSFTFDMLQAIVEEMNRYDESPSDSMRMLNTKPEMQESSRYEYSLQINGKDIPRDDLYENGVWTGNPLQDTFDLGYYIPDNDGGRDYKEAMFARENIVKLEAEKGVFVFKNKDEIIAYLTRIKEKGFNYRSFLEF